MEKIDKNVLSGQITVEWAECWGRQFEFWCKYLLSTREQRKKLKLHLPCKYCQVKRCNIKP